MVQRELLCSLPAWSGVPGWAVKGGWYLETGGSWGHSGCLLDLKGEVGGATRGSQMPEVGSEVVASVLLCSCCSCHTRSPGPNSRSVGCSV